MNRKIEESNFLSENTANLNNKRNKSSSISAIGTTTTSFSQKNWASTIHKGWSSVETQLLWQQKSRQCWDSYKKTPVFKFSSPCERTAPIKQPWHSMTFLILNSDMGPRVFESLFPWLPHSSFPDTCRRFFTRLRNGVWLHHRGAMSEPPKQKVSEESFFI